MITGEKTLRGQIEIHSRVGEWTGTDYKETMVVEITDEISRCRFLTFELDLKDFMRALTGRGGIKGDLTLQGLEVIGMRAENKAELIECDHPFYDRQKLEAAAKAVAAYEVDGWKARTEDIQNHHHYVDGGIEVTFFRHVEEK